MTSSQTKLDQQCAFDPECKGGVHTRGFCLDHYQVFRRQNPDLILRSSKATTLLDKLWDYTLIAPVTSCHEWQRGIDSKGAGRVWHDGKHNQVHRVGYELTVGPIPEGLVLDHLCENRLCWNGRHLEPTTYRANALHAVDHPAHAYTLTTACLCWDRTAPECPLHGQLHWRDDWAELIAEVNAWKLVTA